MYKYILTIILIISCLLTYSQKIPFDKYSIKNGLPSNYITDIEQDSKGYIWLGTQNGVSKFDGYKFINYSIEDGLPSIYISGLFADSKGCIWMGTEEGGVARFDGETFQVFNTENGLISNNKIGKIFEDNEGNIWISTKYDGISKITLDTIINYTDKNGLVNNRILSSYIDDLGKIWLGTAGGLTVISNDTFISYTTEDGLSSNIIWDIIKDKKGLYWLATEEGSLNSFDGRNFRCYASDDGLNSNNTLSLLEDSKGNIWIGTWEKGLFKYDGQGFIPVNRKGLASASVMEIIEDSQGRIWIRTIKSGMYMIYNNKLYYYTSLNDLSDDIISNIFEDKESNIWFGTKSGISKLSNKPFEIYTTDFGLPDKDILTVNADKHGIVWVGTYKGLFKIDPENEVYIFNTKDGYPENLTIYSVFEDRSNNIWLGTPKGLAEYKQGYLKIYRDSHWLDENGNVINLAVDFAEDLTGNIWIAHQYGASRLYNGNYFTLNEDSGLSSNDVRTVMVDHENKIWFGTGNGISVYDYKDFSYINSDNGLSDNSCNDIAVDSAGNIWAGTDNGLNKITLISGGEYEIKIFTTRNGLNSNSIMSVTIDKTNNLWIGHDKGLNKLSLTDESVQFYGELEGFTPLETYQGAISVDNENNVWIGTGDGVVKYIADLDIRRTYPPEIYITGISIHGDSTSIGNYAHGTDSISGLPLNIKLPYNKNNLIFEYTGLHFSNPVKNRYQYKLEGYDDIWSEVTDKTQTDQYKKLPHGSYTFMVRAANCDGIWTEEPASISFVITPPFWKTKLCYALEIILGITLIFLFVKARERKLQHDKKVLAQKVKERTIEIEKQRDKIAEQNREITSSIMYAQRIQSAVLPDEEFTGNILPQHFILFKPRDIVSGDFYWMTEKGNHKLIAAADCTGHGVPGAFMSMLGVSLLNEIVNVTRKYQANKILESLRYNVKETLSQRGKKNEARDGMDIALCILDFKNLTAQFAGAYNPLVLIRNSESIIYKGDKMPIGIHVGHEKPFTNHTFKIAKGDMIYMYTDGYADQFGGPEEKKFKSCTFRELLADIHYKPLDEQKVILDKTIKDWQGDLSQVDDIMVIGIRV